MLELLKRFSLCGLFPKLRDANVTKETLFGLDSIHLDEMNFSEVERLSYRRAKEQWCRGNLFCKTFFLF